MVTISAQIWEKRKIQQRYVAFENGKQVIKQQEVDQNICTSINKPLSDFGAKFSTANGSPLSVEDATRLVRDGATLLVTADGKPIDKGWLRAVSGETVVMEAEGLAHAQFLYNPSNQGNSALPTTAAPRLAMLCADERGAVKVAVNANSGNAYANQVYYDNIGGLRGVRGQAMMIRGGINIDSSAYGSIATPQPAPDGKKLLADVKFDAYDLTGKLVPKSEALKRLRSGGLVLLAGDNKVPDSNYLKAFRGDILVIASGDFVFPTGMPNPYDMAVKSTAAGAGPGKPGPAIALPGNGVVAPVAPVRIVPALIRRAQAAPAPAAPQPAAPQKEATPAAKPANGNAKPAAKLAGAPAKPK